MYLLTCLKLIATSPISICFCTLYISADNDFLVGTKWTLCKSVIYITKHTVLNGFNLRKVSGIQHTIHTIHVLEFKKKNVLKFLSFYLFFWSIKLFLSLSRTWKHLQLIKIISLKWIYHMQTGLNSIN